MIGTMTPIKRRTFLESRKLALEADAETLRENIALGNRKLLDSRARLVEGDATDEPAERIALQILSDETREKHIAAALGQIRDELGPLVASLAAEEHRAEVARQTKASAAARAEADRCVAESIEAFLSIRGPIRRRAALAASIARDFPLAPIIPPLTLDELSVKLRESWPVREHAEATYHTGFKGWLRSVLVGPVQSGSSEDQMRKELNLTN